MKFGLEAEINSTHKRYRLHKSDPDWQPVGLGPSDEFIFNSLEDTKNAYIGLARIGDKVELGGVEYTIEIEDEVGVWDPTNKSNLATVRPVVYRFTKPRLFSYEEVKEVIAKGNENIDNKLIIDLKGYVKIKPFQTEKQMETLESIWAPVAAMGGILSESWTGPEAAEDEEHVVAQYQILLESWAAHLQNGHLRADSDDYRGDRKRIGVLKEIAMRTSHLK